MQINTELKKNWWKGSHSPFSSEKRRNAMRVEREEKEMAHYNVVYSGWCLFVKFVNGPNDIRTFVVVYVLRVVPLFFGLLFFYWCVFVWYVLAPLERMLLADIILDHVGTGESIEAQSHDNVTMLFSDLVGFTAICSTATPMEIISLLQSLYTQFDVLCGDLDIYKVTLFSFFLASKCVIFFFHDVFDEQSRRRWRPSVTLIAPLAACTAPAPLTHNKLLGWRSACWKCADSTRLTTDSPFRWVAFCYLSISPPRASYASRARV